MSVINDNRHSFVIQLWSEPREIADARQQWRGLIEHISSGRREAVFYTEDIVNFIDSFVPLKDRPTNFTNSLRSRLRRRLDSDTSDSEPPVSE
jgi:hypothetical protein